MLALRPTTILPVMTLAEALETMRIHRVGGLSYPPPGAARIVRSLVKGLIVLRWVCDT
jgi:CBS domain-containing protein